MSKYKVPEPKKFVAIQECSNGNAVVGDMWLRVASFQPSTPIAEVYKWASSNTSGGRLMIRPDEDATLAAMEKGDDAG